MYVHVFSEYLTCDSNLQGALLVTKVYETSALQSLSALPFITAISIQVIIDMRTAGFLYLISVLCFELTIKAVSSNTPVCIKAWAPDISAKISWIYFYCQSSCKHLLFGSTCTWAKLVLESDLNFISSMQPGKVFEGTYCCTLDTSQLTHSKCK